MRKLKPGYRGFYTRPPAARGPKWERWKSGVRKEEGVRIVRTPGEANSSNTNG